ncbi:MAG: hypothetical protein ACUVXA_16735 [Candidatus Jordarchaeum sp.]|uniref:hypothetical protein n=1 Tax=Candidatus Jordarchaeum sp. TaxID=2823881 RepID=UPI00404B47B4
MNLSKDKDSVKHKEIHRPAGVVAFSLIFLIVAALMIVIGMVQPPPEVIQYWGDAYAIYFILITGLTPMGGPPGYSALHFWSIEVLFLKMMMWFGLILAPISITSSYGLLRLMNWGRYLALTMGVAYIIIGIFFFIPIVFLSAITLLSVPFILFGIAIIVYFLGDVKYEFGER